MDLVSGFESWRLICWFLFNVKMSTKNSSKIDMKRNRKRGFIFRFSLCKRPCPDIWSFDGFLHDCAILWSLSAILVTSWCHAVIRCHTPTSEHSSIHCHDQCGGQYLFYPVLQQIFAAIVEIWAYSLKTIIPVTIKIGFITSLSGMIVCNNMFCAQCSSPLVPRGWSRLSDIITLSPGSWHVPAQSSYTDRHCIIDELLSLISNTRYLSLSDITLLAERTSCRGCRDTILQYTGTML